MYESTQYPNVIDVKEPGFLASIFGFFALALFVTVIGSMVGFYALSTSPELFSNPLFFGAAIITQLGLVFTSQIWSRRLPFGYGMFSLFAFITGFTMIEILAYAGVAGGSAMLIKALFVSVSVFLAAGLYGWTTQRNLLGMAGFLMISLFGLIVMSIMSIFFPWSNTMEIVVSGASILLFAGFTMYEIQLLQRSNMRNPLMGAMMLYLSFINLFTSVLRFMLAMSNRD